MLLYISKNIIGKPKETQGRKAIGAKVYINTLCQPVAKEYIILFVLNLIAVFDYICIANIQELNLDSYSFRVAFLLFTT